MKLSVLIPTFRRGESLDRCMRGLAEQQRPADQVVIVLRAEDEESQKVVAEWSAKLPITPAYVDRPGQVQALNRGLDEVTGDIAAITDDDTFPHADWLRRIEEHFSADERLGGLGGRDVVHERGTAIPARAYVVGVIQPFGRIIGNHHVGMGGPREVDTLKGANMIWRMTAVGSSRFETDLRGSGAQVYNDMGFCMKIKGKGWRLVYDPQVVVDHFPAPRLDSDQRNAPSEEAIENAAYNLYLLLRRYGGAKGRVALRWAYWIGMQSRPGVLMGWAAVLKKDANARLWRRLASRAWTAAKKAAKPA